MRVRWQWAQDAKHSTQHAVGRALLRQLVATPVAYHRLGQPYVPAQPQLGVSVSHSATLVVAAVAPGPLGIDVERLRPVNWARYRRAFTASEWAFLKRCPTANRQLLAWRLWTAKEAILKLQGCGLTRAPRRVEVALPTLTQATVGPQRYQLSALTLPPGYVGTRARPVPRHT
ncbi:4'-phosphopantetheinyl transferase family protein [Lactiplantibacillus modestisalitolerans]|uniref:4'-phosphopantetheinyl transferase family protein n=1 Tax=Lactiplantibacillus modestisalitolerans TaxID=1457219 RepID=A0ABV5WWG4_9LACO|nr:4'-phosphopantetheinyl transferase superfamily protein [Lactiplantibacillus modestisalitolerans]